jgi:hypothetical protein
LIPHLGDMKKGNWFSNYRSFSDINSVLNGKRAGPISLSIAFLEQVILTRNDFSHNFDLAARRAYQTEERLGVRASIVLSSLQE